YGTTSNATNGMASLKHPVQFWVFDPEQQKVLFQKVTPGLTFKVPQTNHIWLAGPDGLQLFDGQRMAFTKTLPWPKQIGKAKSIRSVDARNNAAWLVVDDHFIKFVDGNTPKLDLLF